MIRRYTDDLITALPVRPLTRPVVLTPHVSFTPPPLIDWRHVWTVGTRVVGIVVCFVIDHDWDARVIAESDGERIRRRHCPRCTYHQTRVQGGRWVTVR